MKMSEYYNMFKKFLNIPIQIIVDQIVRNVNWQQNSYCVNWGWRKANHSLEEKAKGPDF